MIYATKTVELSTIFPKGLPESMATLNQAPQLQRCLDEIPQLSQLYDDQKQALEGMLHSELKHVCIVYHICSTAATIYFITQVCVVFIREQQGRRKHFSVESGQMFGR